MGLTYPKIRAESCVFREQFINAQYVTDNQVTLVSAPTVNNGLYLNGTTQYAKPAGQIRYSFGDGVSDLPFSINAIVNSNDVTNTCIVNKGSWGTTGEYALWFDGSDKITFALYDENVPGTTGFIMRYCSVPSTSLEGTDARITATYDGSGLVTGLAIYVNGVRLDDTSDASTGADTYVAMNRLGADLEIGVYDGALYFNGIIKLISIYNKELDEGEIQDIMTAITFREVDVLQLEYFLPLRTRYNNGVSELTHNMGIIGGDVIKWGDGSVVATFPALLPNNGVSLNGNQYIGTSTGGTFSSALMGCFGGLFKYSSASDTILYDFRNASGEGVGLQAKTTGLLLFRDGLLEGATSVKNCNDGCWHSVFCVLIPNIAGDMTYIMYIDGELDVTNVTTRFTTAVGSKFYMGCDYNTANKFVGSLKFPFLWRILLTPIQARWQHENLFRQFNS